MSSLIASIVVVAALLLIGGGVRLLLAGRRLQGALMVVAALVILMNLAILTVPVLTPKLSSYWISFVTDVDATTGRNLIDSMGTEVIVTDHAIRDLVPGEPLTYREAVRRAVEGS